MGSEVFCILAMVASICFAPAEVSSKPKKSNEEPAEKSNLALVSAIDSSCLELYSSSVQSTDFVRKSKSILDSSIIHALRLLSEFHNTKHAPPKVDLGDSSFTSKIMDISFQSLVQVSMRTMETRGDLSVANAYHNCMSRIMTNIGASELTQLNGYQQLSEYYQKYLDIYQLLTDPQESYSTFAPRIVKLQNDSENLSNQLDKVLR